MLVAAHQREVSVKKVFVILGLSFSSSSCEDSRVLIAARHHGGMEKGISSEQFPVFVQKLTKYFLHGHYFTEKELMDQIFLSVGCKCT